MKLIFFIILFASSTVSAAHKNLLLIKNAKIENAVTVKTIRSIHQSFSAATNGMQAERLFSKLRQMNEVKP